MPYTNWNNVFNSVAKEQGIPIGSGPWIAGGNHAWSGTTGGHPSYGYLHHHKLSPDYVRAVIANYASRACFYQWSGFDIQNDKRRNKYANSGRPLYEYVPDNQSGPFDDVWDAVDGQRVWFADGKVVPVSSGLDPQHHWLNPLWALMDGGNDYSVRCQGKDVVASFVATHIARFYVDAMVGMLRQNLDYNWGDRGCARILETAVQASKRGLMDADDLVAMAGWFANIILHFERAPIVRHDEGSHQLYNGLWYQLPAWYWLRQAMPPLSPFYPRVDAIVARMGQYVIDCVETRPDALSMATVQLPPEVTAPPGGVTVESWKPYIAPTSFDDTATDWAKWGYTAACCARALYPAKAAMLNAILEPIRAKWQGTSEHGWIVDEHYQYATS